MRALLAKVDWPFKVYKTDETTQILQGCMPYFQDFFATKLGIQLAADNVLAAAAKVCPSRCSESLYRLSLSVQFKLPKFQIRRAICNVLLGNGLVKEALACFRRMKSELVEDTSFQNEQLHWDFGKWLHGQWASKHHLTVPYRVSQSL